MSTSPTSSKVALITGVAGQDGLYLAEFLLAKDYAIHGIERREDSANAERLSRLQSRSGEQFILHLVDLTDETLVHQVVEAIRPSEVYNLAAQSSVQASFDAPEATFEINASSLRYLIESIRAVPALERARIFQASSSELYGGYTDALVTELTPFRPQNPYAEAKLVAHEMVMEARRRGMHASNGILFGHESPLRGEAFVTRKITRSVARIHLGLQDKLALGDLDVRRDWGHAREYVEAMWLMLQQDRPDDYIIATGVTASPREFVAAAFSFVGTTLEWRGSGVDEQGYCADTGRILVEVDARFFRPAAGNAPTADTSKARNRLHWSPTITWRELCEEMVREDLKSLEKSDTFLQNH